MASLKGDVGGNSKGVVDAISAPTDIDYGQYATLIITKFIQVLGAALILIIAYFIINRLKKYFEKTETTHEQQKMALNILEKITTGFIVVIAITLALKTVGLDMSLLVSVGLLGLSYGLKDVIKNYIAGILIFLKSPFKIGDIVKIKKFVGKVEKMELQSTTLKTFDQRDITIYNSDIMTKSIENYSRYPIRRMEINVNMGYGSDMEKAVRIFEKILSGHPQVLKTPKHSIIFKKFTENSVITQLKFWIQLPCNMLDVRSHLAWQINQAFDEASIFAPYSKGFEANENYTLNSDRQARIKAFYSSPIIMAEMQTAQTGTQASTPGQPNQPTVEIFDADEPSIEDDI
jgi:small-conductance mechanosensitive channel